MLALSQARDQDCTHWLLRKTRRQMFSLSCLVKFKKMSQHKTCDWGTFSSTQLKKIDENACPSYRLHDHDRKCGQIVDDPPKEGFWTVSILNILILKKNAKKPKYKPSWGPTHLSIISSAGQFSKPLSAQMRCLIINRQVFPSCPHTVESLDAN